MEKSMFFYNEIDEFYLWKTWHFCIILKKLDIRGKLTENSNSVYCM